MKAITVVVVMCAAAVVLLAAPASALSDNRRRLRRVGRSGAAARMVSCSADAMEHAMEQARAGDPAWWESVKKGLGTAVDAVGDAATVTGKAIGKAAVVSANAVADASVVSAKAVAKGAVISATAVADASVVSAKAVADAAVITVDALNFIKGWECHRCEYCTKFSSNLASKILKALIDAGGQAVATSACLGFDSITTGLCTSICGLIPIPGLCPTVCPPFIVYAHLQCGGLVMDVYNEVMANAVLKQKLIAKTLSAADHIKGLEPERICTKLSLCPKARNDCDKPLVLPSAKGLVTPPATTPAPVPLPIKPLPGKK